MAENPENLENKTAGEQAPPRIDPDVPWHEEHNRDAARKLRWRYSPRRRVYVDSDGEKVADRFGQSY